MCKKAEEIEKMTTEELLKEFAHLKATEKGIADSIKTLKGKILEKMGENKSMTEGKFTATLTAKSRKTLSKNLVEEVLGVKVTDACYTITNYEELRVTE